MSDTGPPTPTQTVDDRQDTRGRYTTLIVCAAVALGVLLVLVSRQPVARWWQLRTAYQNLSSEDSTDQRHAHHVLLEPGENPDESLIALLLHPSEGVRYFAAYQLAERP